MLRVPEQRRPPCTRHRERYESPVLLAVALMVNAAVGWQVVSAHRLEDGRVEACYER